MPAALRALDFPVIDLQAGEAVSAIGALPHVFLEVYRIEDGTLRAVNQHAATEVQAKAHRGRVYLELDVTRGSVFDREFKVMGRGEPAGKRLIRDRPSINNHLFRSEITVTQFDEMVVEFDSKDSHGRMFP